MLSARGFTQKLKRFEQTYEDCLNTVSSLASGTPTTEGLGRFQPILYHSLLQLVRGYHEIRREREALVTKKKQLSKTWHDRRQRVLAERQQVLLRAIRLGRSLGDAYVWFFYRNDPALLQEHAKQPPSSLPPAGDGGEGELALIDAVRTFDGKFILFHGITTMFRLGDASLVDLTTQRIVGIGELKTTRVDAKTLNMHFQISVQPGTQFSATAAAPKPENLPPPSQLSRLKKQMSRISHAAARADRPPQANLEVQVVEMAHVQDLDAVVAAAKTRKVVMRQVSPGLVILAFRSGQRSLRSRLESITSLQKNALVGLDELARNILATDTPHNMLFLSRNFYSDTWEPIILSGSSPMLLWHLKPETKQAIATGAVVISTLFNPAHVFKHFTDQGWSLGIVKPGSEFSLKRQRADGKTLGIGNVQYFLQLVASGLYREDYVIRIMTDALSRIDSEGLGEAPIELNFTHHIFF
jgi:hypothetical protein